MMEEEIKRLVNLMIGFIFKEGYYDIDIKINQEEKFYELTFVCGVIDEHVRPLLLAYFKNKDERFLKLRNAGDFSDICDYVDDIVMETSDCETKIKLYINI